MLEADPPSRVHARPARADLGAAARAASTPRRARRTSCSSPGRSTGSRCEEAQRLDYRPAAARRALRAALGDVLVPPARDGARTRGPARRVDLLWATAQRGDALARTGEPSQGLHDRPPAPDAMLVERRAAASASSSRSSSPATGSSAGTTRRRELRALRARALRRGRVAALPRLRDAARARGDRDGLDPALGAASCAGAQPLLQRARPDAILARALRAPQRRRARTSSRAIGHAHIDTAWLWPLAETLPQGVRTFSEPAALHGRVPGVPLRVLAGAAVRVDRGARARPLGADPREGRGRAVRPGRRQLGRARLQPPLGRVARAPVPARPALLRGARSAAAAASSGHPTRSATAASCRSSCALRGITRFLTQKLSWNRFNRPEHHTFIWQGDRRQRGARRTSRRPTPTTATRASTSCCGRRASSRTTSRRAHEPARLRLRRRRRRPDARDARDAAPRARPAGPAAHAAPRRATSSSTRSRPSRPSGPSSSASCTSSTTAASTRRRRSSKRGNRRCEQLLHDAEFLGGARGGDYPRAELDRLWKLLLLQQFHDILPGSSIGLVYEDARARLRGARGRRGGDALLGAGRDAPVNTIGVRAARGRRRPTAVVSRRRRTATARVVEAARRGARRRPRRSRTRTCACELGADGTRRSASSRRRRGRETLAAPGNRLELYEDRPGRLRRVGHRPVPPRDARATARRPSRARSSPTAPLRAEVAFERRVGEREPLRQVVRLDAGVAAARVPHDGRLARGAQAAEGLLPARRPRAEGDLRDAVRLRRAADALLDELRRARATRCPGHRFADLSEHGFGAALLTDSQVRLQLLRRASCGSACCARRRARTPRPTWAGTSSRTRSSRTPAAGARPASSPRRRASTRRCAWTRRRGGAVARVGRRPEPRARHDQARRRTRTRSCCGSTRRTARAASARVRLAAPVRRARGSRTRSRTTAAPLAVDGGAIRVPYRPHEIADGEGSSTMPRRLRRARDARHDLCACRAHPGPRTASSRPSASVAGGGPAATAAVALARLGVDVAFVGVGRRRRRRRARSATGLDARRCRRLGARGRAGARSPQSIDPRRRRHARDRHRPRHRAAAPSERARASAAAPTGCTSTTSATRRAPAGVAALGRRRQPDRRASTCAASTSTRRPSSGCASSLRHAEAALDAGAELVVVTRGAAGSAAYTRRRRVVEAPACAGRRARQHARRRRRLPRRAARAARPRARRSTTRSRAANAAAALSCRALDGRSAIPTSRGAGADDAPRRGDRRRRRRPRGRRRGAQGGRRARPRPDVARPAVGHRPLPRARRDDAAGRARRRARPRRGPARRRRRPVGARPRHAVGPAAAAAAGARPVGEPPPRAPARRHPVEARGPAGGRHALRPREHRGRVLGRRRPRAPGARARGRDRDERLHARRRAARRRATRSSSPSGGAASLTSATKSNASRYGYVLWDEVAEEVAAAHPGREGSSACSSTRSRRGW